MLVSICYIRTVFCQRSFYLTAVFTATNNLLHRTRYAGFASFPWSRL